MHLLELKFFNEIEIHKVITLNIVFMYQLLFHIEMIVTNR